MDWKQVERVYVRLPNWVGDVVLATPMLSRLRQVAPQAQILGHGKGFHLKLLAHEGLFDRPEPVQKPGLPGLLPGSLAEEALVGAIRL